MFGLLLVDFMYITVFLVVVLGESSDDVLHLCFVFESVVAKVPVIDDEFEMISDSCLSSMF